MQKLLEARNKKIPFRLRFAVQSHFAYLPFLTRIFKPFSLKSHAVLTQILVEAFNNVVVHAHKQKPSCWVDIDLKWSRKQVILRVSDEGSGLAHLKKREKPTLWQTHGRGLALIESLASHVRSMKKGKKHTLEVIYNNGKESL